MDELFKIFSGIKLCDYVRQRSLSSVNFYGRNNVSDNESECSYTDLLNEYASIKISNNCNDKENVEQLTGNGINELKDDVFNDSYENDTGKHQLNSRKSSTWSDENVDLEHLVPVQYVVKWSAQLLLAFEKLHALGVIVK